MTGPTIYLAVLSMSLLARSIAADQCSTFGPNCALQCQNLVGLQGNFQCSSLGAACSCGSYTFSIQQQQAYSFCQFQETACKSTVCAGQPLPPVYSCNLGTLTSHCQCQQNSFTSESIQNSGSSGTGSNGGIGPGPNIGSGTVAPPAAPLTCYNMIAKCQNLICNGELVNQNYCQDPQFAICQCASSQTIYNTVTGRPVDDSTPSDGISSYLSSYSFASIVVGILFTLFA